MSTEKMRQGFERYECESGDGPQTDPVWLMYDDAKDEYVLDQIQERWKIWQASRADIEIELPQQSGANRDWNQAIRYCHEAIESLGLKVKP